MLIAVQKHICTYPSRIEITSTATKADCITKILPSDGTRIKYTGFTQSKRTATGVANKIKTGSDFIKKERKVEEMLPIIKPRQQNITDDKNTLIVKCIGLKRIPIANSAIMSDRTTARMERVVTLEII
jgi:hypothetical protein